MKTTEKRVLIVDDDPNFLDVYADMFTASGYRVETANSAEAALPLMRNGGYDAILVDVMLPNMTGIELITEYRKVQPDQPNGKMVLITNLRQACLHEEIRALGVDACLDKIAVTPPEIVTRVEELAIGHKPDQH